MNMTVTFPRSTISQSQFRVMTRINKVPSIQETDGEGVGRADEPLYTISSVLYITPSIYMAKQLKILYHTARRSLFSNISWLTHPHLIRFS